ncbi:pilus assembly protein [Thermosulfurimonas marina]|nr:PilC/PilY family type IV pilus protein [Thermosulfurimonas marina]
MVPPFISKSIPPNVLLVVDVSGSMSWPAYWDIWDSNTNPATTYNATRTYEGYFIPHKVYTYNSSSNTWEESSSPADSCQPSCSWIWSSWGGYWQCGLSESNSYTGSCLNYVYMTRIDLLRWAITGGKPDSCPAGNPQIQRCDPELYGQPDAQLSCDASGCVLETYNGEKVKVPWERIYQGLAFQLKDLPFRPRLGVLFYSGTGVVDKVYIGDFTSSANFDAVNPYKNTITHLNAISPYGATPTAPALWDAYNYFAQNQPEYGGFQPQSGQGDEWKNPLYQCFDEDNNGNCQGNELKLVPCAKNFVILLSDGQWNVGGAPADWTCTIDTGFEEHSADPVVPAYWLHAKGFTNKPTGQKSRVEALYAIGLFLGGTGEQSLKNVAMYGSFDLAGGKTWPDGLSDYPRDTCRMDDCCDSDNCGKGSACTPLPSSSTDWDQDGNGVPDTFFSAKDAQEIREAIWNAIQDILRRASSGTAAAMLASKGSGALLAQAAFYPRRDFSGTEIDWVGELQTFWYYLDPWLKNANILEETPPRDLILDLSRDCVIHFRFDGTNTLIDRWCDTDGDGVADSYVNSVKFEEAHSLFRAGEELCAKAPSERTIYTQVNGTLVEFTPAEVSQLCPYLLQGSCTNSTLAERYIRWVRGEEFSEFRSRTVPCGVWKLGDIISSTPVVLSSFKLEPYDETPPLGYLDGTYARYIQSDLYKNRGYIFVGANDGMLHAFHLGILKELSGRHKKAEISLNDTSGLGLGEEAWAFIPQNVLPYLQYLTRKDYCHLYLVDAPPVVVDASIAGDNCTGNYWECLRTDSSWRTILIGGMGLGGATSENCTANGTCVPTPMSGLGFSSYFALDVTDPLHPKFLWEFTHPELGFSTSGPAVVRVGDAGRNGRWFVVLASGPTGRVNQEDRSFTGESSQDLKLFVLDLKTGECVLKDNLGNCKPIDTEISEAFAGSLINASIDTDRHRPGASGFYSDDAVYVGYTQKISKGDQVEWKGGVLRLLIKDDPDPSHWEVKPLIQDIGPVTTSVAKLQDRRHGKLWIYFGTGRYFHKQDTPDDQQALYGVKDPCYDPNLNDFSENCTNPTLTLKDLEDRSADNAPSPWNEPTHGWYINLDPANSTSDAERLITNPNATFSGVVYFTTFAPESDICSLGGKTHVWTVKYNTGGAATSLVSGVKVLIQLSTAAIEEISLPEALTERGGRRTGGYIGVPPQLQGMAVIGRPRPQRRVIHVQEK